ncbi:MAG: peptide chain release factor N(5)-glutamine methyltransferase [Chitinophagales bacterium]|nr:peptide chain release factor N(5)-glutamine methyltransferase [Chitinophagales bacterium]
MHLSEAIQHIQQSIHEIYDEREAFLIAKYLTEDLIGTGIASNHQLTEVEIERIQQAIKRLLNHEPWQYISGYADFYGLKFKVTPDVLIPRPETEELVSIALDLIKEKGYHSIMDIGTGSGIIPITIGKKAKNVPSIYATDISVQALDIAIQNAQYHGVHINWIENDILQDSHWANLPKVDMVLSNPPYIGQEEAASLSEQVIAYEPHLALFTHHHSLEFYDAISKMVMLHQNRGCKLLSEINEKYGQEVVDLYKENGLIQVELLQDLQGKDRIVTGTKP